MSPSTPATSHQASRPFAPLILVWFALTLVLCSCSTPVSKSPDLGPLKRIEDRCAIRIHRVSRLEACAANAGVWFITAKDSRFVLLNDGAAYDISVSPGLLKVVPEWGEIMYFDTQPGATISLAFKARVGVPRTEITIETNQGAEWRVRPQIAPKTLAIRNHTRLPEKELNRILKLGKSLPTSWRISVENPDFELHLDEDAYHFRTRLVRCTDGSEVWSTGLQKEPYRTGMFWAMYPGTITVPGTYIIARDVDEIAIESGLFHDSPLATFDYSTCFSPLGRLLSVLPEIDHSGQILPTIWRNRRLLRYEYTNTGFFACFDGGQRFPIRLWGLPLPDVLYTNTPAPTPPEISATAVAIAGKSASTGYLQRFFMSNASYGKLYDVHFREYFKDKFTADAFLIMGEREDLCVCVTPGTQEKDLKSRLEACRIAYVINPKDSRAILIGSLSIHFSPQGVVSAFSIGGWGDCYRDPLEVTHLVEP